MAEDAHALMSVAKSALPKLGDLAIKEAMACWSARGDLEDLEETMEMIQDVLLDAEEKKNKNRAVKRWLLRLKTVLYEADDTFDEVLARDKSKELDLSILQKVRAFFSASNSVWLSWTISNKVKSIRAKLDKITADMEHFNFKKHQPEDDLVGIHMSSRRQEYRDETTSRVEKETIVGREDDIRKIEILLGVEGSRTVPKVIAIVGLGGLGKTTLAQLVYNNSFVNDNFELKAWACVYDEGNRREFIEGKILRSLFLSLDVQPDGKNEEEAQLIRSIRGEKYEEVDLNRIETEIEKLLENKKYVIVLDDVWDERHEKWDHFFGFLRKGKAGSKVVATMRSELVAHALNDSEPYELRELEMNKALELFEGIALRPEWKENPYRKTLLQEIFDKCPKLPLVLQTVGSMLYVKVNVEEWESIKENVSAILMLGGRETTNIMKVLKVSYNHLPPHLKSCFAYCALFPKDHELDKQKLVCLWMAQGFIQPPIGDETLEDVGNSYFVELLKRSFFLTLEIQDYNGGRVCVKMHDAMHDLAQYVSKEEVGVIGTNTRERWFSKGLRHVVLENCLGHTWPLHYAGHIRSILSFGPKDMASFAKLIASSYTCLRVLDFHDMRLQRVPSCVGELIHLRFLDLGGNEMTHLPNSITKLINLQTLNLYGCQKLSKLPNHFSRLVNIRLLNIEVCEKLSCMPHGFGPLTSLQTLEGDFSVSKAHLSERSNGGLDTLLGLTNLKGELVIRYHGWDTRDLESLETSLKINDAELKVNKLKIKFEWEAELASAEAQAQSVSGETEAEVPLLSAEAGSRELELVLSIFQQMKFRSLHILEIFNCPAVTFPEWNSAVIPFLYRNLVKISFQGLSCTSLPPLSRLRHLRSLSVGECRSLKYMEEGGDPESSTFFPSLEELYMEKLDLLIGWSSNSSSIFPPSFHLLFVAECPQLDTIPIPQPETERSFRSLQHLEILKCGNSIVEKCKEDNGEYWHLIQHIPVREIRN